MGINTYLIYSGRNRQYQSDIQHIAFLAPVGAYFADPAWLAAMLGASPLVAKAGSQQEKGIEVPLRLG